MYQLANDFGSNEFSINGGIKTLEDALNFRGRGVHFMDAMGSTTGNSMNVESSNVLRGAMIGRGAWSNPFQFANADKVIYGEKNPGISRHEALESYIDYAEYHMSENDGKLSRQCLQRLLKPCMNLFAGEPGGNLFRRRIDESVNIKRKNDIRSIILEALEEVDQVAVDKIY